MSEDRPRLFCSARASRWRHWTLGFWGCLWPPPPPCFDLHMLEYHVSLLPCLGVEMHLSCPLFGFFPAEGAVRTLFLSPFRYLVARIIPPLHKSTTM